MSDAKFVKIAQLVTTYNLVIEHLPENLKCAQCKLLLKYTCQVPCGCRYCRDCIDDMMVRGSVFCPGDSDECGESLLSCYQSDYLANKGVSRLVVKCPHDGCVHKCQLAKLEEHLRECQRKDEECPFRELGCTQDKLAVEEMGGHLQHEYRRHSEILIRMIANIKTEVETLRRRDEVSRREIETLKQRDEASSKNIETLNEGLVLKDEQIKSIMKQMKHMQNDIKSIKEEKENLANRVIILTDEIDKKIAQRRESDGLDSARLIEHMDREIAAVTLLIGSNKGEFVSEIQALKSNIGSINQDVLSIKDNIFSVKSQVQSVQELLGLEQFDASFVLLIDDDVDKTRWYRHGEFFTGDVHPYKYRLASENYDIGTARAELWIAVQIYAGPNDGQLPWPFEARVVITVTDRDRREACRSMTQQCQIERPPDNDCSWSDAFEFLHSELREAGLNLSRGVRVSCVIVPRAVEDVIDTCSD